MMGGFMGWMMFIPLLFIVAVLLLLLLLLGGTNKGTRSPRAETNRTPAALYSQPPQMTRTNFYHSKDDHSVTTEGRIVQRSSASDRMKICPYCGRRLDFPEESNFCPYCEKRIQKRE